MQEASSSNRFIESHSYGGLDPFGGESNNKLLLLLPPLPLLPLLRHHSVLQYCHCHWGTYRCRTTDCMQLLMA